MKSTLSRVLVLAALLSTSAWLASASTAPSAVAQDQKPPSSGEEPRGEPRGGPERRGGRRGEGMGIHQAMEQMETEVKKLEASIADPARTEETVRALSRMIQFTGASLTGAPKNQEKIAADARDAHMLAFRRDLLKMVKELADIELLVLDGKHADAAAALTAKVLTPAGDAHKKYGVDQE